jgi:DNA-binding SARP family transcriptional activator
MLRLRTFGTASLERDDGPLGAAGTQRRRLALLALLAVARDRGVTRDKLVAYLWPERDESARHLLAQTIYAMRRELATGDDDLFVGTDPVILNEQAITADVVEFERLLDRGDADAAVALYHGPFLDGFHLGGSAEFDRWLESTRSHLLRRQRDALTALAARAEKTGDFAAAAQRWRELAALDPLEASTALGLMQALAKAGNRPAAIQHARVYDSLVRQELDVDPDPRVSALAERIRADEAKDAAAISTSPPSTAAAATRGSESTAQARRSASRTSRAGNATRGTPLRLALDVNAVEKLLAARQRSSLAVQRWSSALARFWRGVPIAARALSIAMPLAIAGLWLGLHRHGAEAATPASSRVAVLPFAIHGAQKYAYLRGALVELLSTSLEGMDRLHSVDARSVLRVAGDTVIDPDVGRVLAARVGARTFVLGDVTEASGVVQIDAALYDVDSGRATLRSRASAKGSADSVFRLVEGLTSRLVALRGAERDSGLAELAAREPLPVLRAYLEGKRAFADRRVTDAVDEFERAVRADSTFPAGWYQLALAQSWLLDADEARGAAQRAVDLSSGISRERVLFQATLAYVSGSADDAERQYRGMLAANTDDIEAWRGLGEVLFHYNWQRGRPVSDSRSAWERVLRDDPDDWGAMQHLMEIAARESRVAELDSLVVRQERAHPEPSTLLPAQALRAYMDGNRQAQLHVLDESRRLTHFFPTIAAWELAVHAGNLDAAREVATALIVPSRRPEVLALAHITVAQLELAHGRVRNAKREMQAADSLFPTLASRFDALMLAAPFVPATREELIAARQRLARQPGGARDPRITTPSPWLEIDRGLDTLLDTYLSAALSLRLGDRATAVRDAQRLSRSGDDASTRLARALGASVRAEAEGTSESSSGVAPETQFSYARAFLSPYYSLGLARFTRARRLETAGSAGDAIRTYAAFTENSLYDLAYAAPAQLARARLLARAGDRAGAALAFASAARLWRDCDPELRPMLTDAERALGGAQHP